MMNMRFLLLKIYYFLMSLVSLSLATSCDREVPNANLPDTKAKLVINSFISPQDSLLQVFVYESAPVPGGSASSDLVQNATVTLSDGNRHVLLPGVKQFPDQTTAPFTVYQLPEEALPIEAGKTYSLKVTVPDGRAVEAQCTVPAANTTLQVEANRKQETGNDPRTPKFEFRYEWQASAAQESYYRVAGNFTIRVAGLSGGMSGDVSWRGRKDLFLAASPQSLTATGETNFFFSSPNTSYEYELDAYLLTTDVHYYRYHQSLRNHISSDENPFAEPTLVYSNIKNGLGVFAAYNQTKVTISMPQ